MTASERATVRDWLLRSCGRACPKGKGPVPMERLEDLAVEAYWRNRRT